MRSINLSHKTVSKKKLCLKLLFALIVVAVATLLIGILSLKAYAFNIYNVTKISSGLTIDGADTVNENTDYSFTLTKDDPSQELETGFVDIENAQYTNFNTRELSSTPAFLYRSTGSSSAPKVTLVEDTDSPLMEAGGHKRLIGVNYEKIPTGTGNFGLYSSFSSTNFWSSRPTEFSLGFWLKDEHVTNIIGDKDLEIWAIHQVSGPRHISLKAPIQTLMNNPNVHRPITAGGTRPDKIFQSYIADAVCLHRTNGWSYFTFNLRNIVYAEEFPATDEARTYMLFNDFSASFRTPGTELEMTGITMTNKAITNGHIIYPDTVGNDYKMFLLPKDQTDFTISGQYIYGDVTITARLRDTISPLITGVSDNQIIDLADNPEGVTPNTTDTDIQTVVLTRNSVAIPDYQLGQSVATFGNYTLTVTDYSGNVTTVSFTIINSKKSVYITLSGTDLYTRFDYDDTQDFVEVLLNATSSAWREDSNRPVDFRHSYLIGKDTPTTTIGDVVGYSSDDSAPFNFNGSYIGANHGQSAGTRVTTSNAHGKTYADIGSVWKDSDNKRFNLIRIIDENNLLFLTDYDGTHARYVFPGNGSMADGNLTHVSDAEHTSEIIVGSVATAVQVRPALSNRSLSINCYFNGVKQIITNEVVDKVCDYVDIEEGYSIVNPSYIVETIVNNKPVGGYTSNPDITLGSPILNYNMTYRLQPDGAVLSIFNHKILEDLYFNYYGGLQYILGPNPYLGGKKYRYMPGTKPFTVNTVPYNFAVPFDLGQNFPNPTYLLGSNNWENPNLVPNRQIDYYRDGTSQDIIAFATGFLPLDGGTLSARANNVMNSISLPPTKKTYHRFVDAKAFQGTSTENYEIKGISYRKYFNTKEDANSLGSLYTIDYEGYTYAYLDFFSFGETQVNLSPELAGNNAELI